MKKQFMGKYASGNRRAFEQAKASRDFIKSLPLEIRKAIKARDALQAEMCAMVSGQGVADRDAYIQIRQRRDELSANIDQMIKEYHHAATN